MKILLLTSSNPYITAGIVALDLYKGLSEIEGNQVKMLVRTWGEYNDVNIISFDSRLRFLKKKYFKKLEILIKMFLKFFVNKVKKTDPNYSIQDFDQTITYHSTQKILNKIDFVPDRIIVLFMQKFLSFKNLYELNDITKAPIYLYMMDMAPLTGGCHYAWNCVGYKHCCGSCVGMISNIEFDQSRKNWEYKYKFIKKTNLTLVAGTEHQFRQLNQSSLYSNKKKSKILIGIDSKVYKPGNKSEIRKFFNVPTDKKIIFFGAVGVNVKRKGFDKLLEALNILKSYNNQNNIHLIIGGNFSKKTSISFPFDYTLLGYLNHSNLIKAFQAADVFVSPSVEDSGPMMINQSIMCGTPVVAFEMGVALDLVISNRTGYLAKLGDVNDLSFGINSVINSTPTQLELMTSTCRNLGLLKCELNKQSSLFFNLIK